MSDLPLVSIITPSFNQGPFLEDTIRSVLSQSYPHLEYILIDAGSTDNSLEIIHRYSSKLAYWISEVDRGQAHAINKGLQRAQGEILGWLNSDDLLLPDAVSQVVQVFLEEPETGVVYGRLERIDENGRLLPTPELPKDRTEFSIAHVLGECIVNQPGAFWRRSVMDQAGLLNESLSFSLDYEYWIRLALLGVKFKKLPQVVAHFRLSSGSKTVSQATAMALEQMKVLEWLIDQAELSQRLGISSQKIEQQACHTRARFCLQAFYGCVKQGDWFEASRWLIKTMENDLLAIFEPRWLKLGLASFQRRWR